MLWKFLTADEANWEKRGFYAAVMALLVSFLGFSTTILELKELNAKASIAVDFKFVNEINKIGPEFTEPIDFYVVPRNVGEKDIDNWEVFIAFCDGVIVSTADSRWVNTNSQLETYYYKGDKLLYIDQAYFNPKIKSIGAFSLIFPTENKSEYTIPFASIHTSGQNAIPSNRIASWNFINGENYISYTEDYPWNVQNECTKIASKI